MVLRNCVSIAALAAAVFAAGLAHRSHEPSGKHELSQADPAMIVEEVGWDGYFGNLSGCGLVLEHPVELRLGALASPLAVVQVDHRAGATAASGVATKTITGALAGTVTMEATSAGLTTGPPISNRATGFVSRVASQSKK